MEKKSSPRVSIIIPFFNVEFFFAKCIISLFEQTFNDIEYIFIDDCSQDNSRLILEDLLIQYPQRKALVKIISHNSNLGIAYSRKEGIINSEGDFIIHCDSDDWMESNMIDKMYNTALKEDADIISCGCYVHNQDGISIYKHDSINNLNTLKINNIEGVLFSSLWDKMVKRQVYFNNNILPFDGINYWEDLGITIRLRYYSNKIICIPDLLYHYNRLNSTSICTIMTKEKVNDQVKCSKKIEDFFRDKQDREKYSTIISYLKLCSKDNFFSSNNDLRHFSAWKTTFPEVNTCIWKFKRFSLFRKMIYQYCDLISCQDFPSIVYFIWKVKSLLKIESTRGHLHHFSNKIPTN